jgi:hypothetical protein
MARARMWSRCATSRDRWASCVVPERDELSLEILRKHPMPALADATHRFSVGLSLSIAVRKTPDPPDNFDNSCVGNVGLRWLASRTVSLEMQLLSAFGATGSDHKPRVPGSSPGAAMANQIITYSNTSVSAKLVLRTPIYVLRAIVSSTCPQEFITRCPTAASGSSVFADFVSSKPCLLLIVSEWSRLRTSSNAAGMQVWNP